MQMTSDGLLWKKKKADLDIGLLVCLRKLIYRNSLSNLFWSISQDVICN